MDQARVAAVRESSGQTRNDKSGRAGGRKNKT
jgi:hypothetical protein